MFQKTIFLFIIAFLLLPDNKVIYLVPALGLSFLGQIGILNETLVKGVHSYIDEFPQSFFSKSK